MIGRAKIVTKPLSKNEITITKWNKGKIVPLPSIFKTALVPSIEWYGHKLMTMRNYEVTFIVDPVLSADEIDGTAANYVDHLKKQDCTIVDHDKIGLRQLAYPINKRTSGVYHCIEFTVDTNNVIEKLELALRRDERVMRFLTVALDKYGVKYNQDKRDGLIGKANRAKAEVAAEVQAEVKAAKKEAPAPAPAPAPETPAAEAPASEEEE